jgi:RNA polymerase sigma-70 factor, ECF subfamily
MNSTVDNTSVADSALSNSQAMFNTDLQKRLERFARKHLGDTACAQDAVQATIVALLTAKVLFRGESSYQTYAIGILRHKIGDVLNERRRYVSLTQSDSQDNELEMSEVNEVTTDRFTAPERHVHSAGLIHAIQQSLACLSPRSRQTFVMRERLGLNCQEVAAQMELSVGNTGVLLCRAKQQLRASLLSQGYAPHTMQAH